MLRAGQLALFRDADFWWKCFFACGGIGRAVEKAAQIADVILEFVDGAGFLEGLAAAEVGGFLTFARVGFAGQEVLARRVDVVGAAFGGHDCGVYVEIMYQCYLL